MAGTENNQDNQKKLESQQQESMSLALAQDHLKDRRKRHFDQQAAKAENIHVPPTDLDKNDNITDILQKTFENKETSISMERQELALQVILSDEKLQELKAKGADKWSVEKGELFIKKGDETLWNTNLLPKIQSPEAKKDIKETYQHEYKLGDHESSAPVEKPKQKVEGSADGVSFSNKLKDEDWYIDQKSAAELLLSIYDKHPERFNHDEPTNTLIVKNREIMGKLASLTSVKPEDVKTNFEDLYTNKRKIFGPRGVYNTLLAFQRIRDVYPNNDTLLNDTSQLFLTITKKHNEKTGRYVKVEERKSQNVEGDLVKGAKGKEAEIESVYKDLENTNNPNLLRTDVMKPQKREPEFSSAMKTHPAPLVQSAEQLSETIKPDVASKILIDSYKTNGINAFMLGLNRIKATNPEKAQTVLDIIFKELGNNDRATGIKLMDEIVKEYKPDLKKNFNEKLLKNIETEPNIENKKVLNLMKLLSDIKYKAENPGENKEQKRESNVQDMPKILALLGSIKESRVTDEYRDFFITTKNSIESQLRQSMGLDILATTKGGLDATLTDRKKGETTFADSLEELRKLDKTKLMESLDGWVDTDAKVYLASQHVLEAMRLYIRYLYPQEIRNGEKIQNPLKWAFEQLNKGTKISIPKDFPIDQTDKIFDVHKDPKEPVETLKPGESIDVDSLFANKTEELRLFDEYQKGEEQIGETTVWNLVPTNATEGAKRAILAAPQLGPLALTGGAIVGQIAKWTGLGERVKGEKSGFMADDQRDAIDTILLKDHGMMSEADKLFVEDISKLMNENGELGSVEKLQLAKIDHLRKIRSYEEAREMVAGILADKLAQPTPKEIDDKAKKIKEELGTTLNSQINVMIKKDPILSQKPEAEIETMVATKTVEILNNKAYIELIGEKAATIDQTNLTDFEKQAVDILNSMNGEKGIPLKDENLDRVTTIAKMIVEIVAIEFATAGAGSLVAGAAGAEKIAAAGGGFNVARKTGLSAKAFEMGSRLREFKGAGRVGKFVGNQTLRVGKFIESQTLRARVGKTLIHAAAFTEGQHLMHGKTLFMDRSAEGLGEDAYTVASTALMMGALGTTKKFFGGNLGGTPLKGVDKAGAEVAMATEKGTSFLGRGIGKASLATGEFLASRPKARFLAEISTELLAMDALRQAENSEFAREVHSLIGKYSAEELDAMRAPNEWAERAQMAGLILGLRTWGGISSRMTTPSVEVKTPESKVPPTVEPKSENDGPNSDAAVTLKITETPKENSVTQAIKSVKVPDSGSQESPSKIKKPRDFSWSGSAKELFKELEESKDVIKQLDMANIKAILKKISSEVSNDFPKDFVRIADIETKDGKYEVVSLNNEFQLIPKGTTRLFLTLKHGEQVFERLDKYKTKLKDSNTSFSDREKLLNGLISHTESYANEVEETTEVNITSKSVTRLKALAEALRKDQGLNNKLDEKMKGIETEMDQMNKHLKDLVEKTLKSI